MIQPSIHISVASKFYLVAAPCTYSKRACWDQRVFGQLKCPDVYLNAIQIAAMATYLWTSLFLGLVRIWISDVSPVLLLFIVGIGNTSEASYIKAFASTCVREGFQVAVLNHLGGLEHVALTGNRIFTYGLLCTVWLLSWFLHKWRGYLLPTHFCSDDDWSIQSKRRQVIFQAQGGNRWPLHLCTVTSEHGVSYWNCVLSSCMVCLCVCVQSFSPCSHPMY